MPRTPNSPKYARSFRTWAEFRVKRSASSCEETVFTPSSSSCRRHRVYTERRRIVISGIFGSRSPGRRGLARQPGGPTRNRARPAGPVTSSELEDEDDRDDEHVQRQGLDEGEPQEHRREHAPGHARLARPRLDRRRGRPPPPEPEEPGRDREADAGGEESEGRVQARGRGRALRGERQARRAENRQTDDKQ